MPLSWWSRRDKLRALLGTEGDEDQDSVALDNILHGKNGPTGSATALELEKLRFTDRDLHVVGTLEYGQYGVIDVVNCRLDGRVYIRKTTEKRLALRTRDQCSPQTERDLLLLAAKTNSHWVPHLLCAYQTTSHLNLVMDYAEGGTLWDILESSPSNGRVSETDLKWWIPQVASAIDWCHSQGFVHRDIKPHNFVITPAAHVLLIDFGTAAPLVPGTRILSREHCIVPCGTCDYISPEIIKAHEEALVAIEIDDDDEDEPRSLRHSIDKKSSVYGVETDWWSCGAMLYEMAYGVAPFFANDIRQTYSKIMDHKTYLRFDSAAGISASLQDFIRRLLTDAEHRLGRRSIAEIMEHLWFEVVDWTSLHSQTPPPLLHLPQFAYQSAPPQAVPPEGASTENQSMSSKGFAFSALFQSSQLQSSQARSSPISASPALNALHATPAVNKSALRDGPDTHFIGFSWGPAKDAFDDVLNQPPPSPSDAYTPPPIGRTFSAPASFLQPDITSPSANTGTLQYTTPVRPVSAAPQTLLRTGTVRRTTSARRSISDREAMKQLVDCIGLSARKRVLESGRKARTLQAKPSFGTLKRAIRFAHVSTVSDSSMDSASGQFELASRFLPPAFDESETESEGLPPSPSPSPRPGSAMSMTMSRRSQTPTLSATHSGTYSGKLTLSATLPSFPQASLPPIAQSRIESSPPLPSPPSPQSPSSPQSESYSMGSADVSDSGVSLSLPSLEARHCMLMEDIEDMEQRLRRFAKLSNEV